MKKADELLEVKQITKYLLVPQNHRKRLECYSYQIKMPS